MEALVQQGVTRLLVEGGPATWRAFSEAGLVDEAVVFQARAESAPQLPAVEALARYIAAGSLQFCGRRTVGDSDMITFRRRWLSGAQR
jgi:diaminohydroxyphosphoribosylaminopyrimidine deaminase/5-amino-6-(5-phosphoribosylamino)uracil reductase